jgi:hypothetical protein
MRLDFRVFSLAKDHERPEENQDAWAIDPRRGIAAVADGVSSAIFSRYWATILTEAVIAQPPEPDDAEGFRTWLAQQRDVWANRIDLSRLAWYQKAKIKDGAFSTLLWICLHPSDDGDPAACRIRGYAVGDCCLFVIRDGALLGSFPVQTAAELEVDPLAVGSLDLKRDDRLVFQPLDDCGREGDMLVLCTDAVAHWAFTLQESGSPVNWEAYWDMPEVDWQVEVIAMRDRREMRFDDATLMLLRLCADGDEAERIEDRGSRIEDGDEAERIEDRGSRIEEGSEGKALPPGTEEQTAENSGDASQTLPSWLPQSAMSALPGKLDEWKEKIKTLSGQVVDETGKQVARGLGKIRQATESAESAVQEYLKKLRKKE